MDSEERMREPELTKQELEAQERARKAMQPEQPSAGRKLLGCLGQLGCLGGRGCFSGCLLSVILYIAFFVMLFVILEIFFPTEQVELKENTIYRLELKGTLVEQAKEENPFEEMFGSMQSYVSQDEQVGLDQILSNIRLAKTDDRVLGIWLDGGQLSMTPAGGKAIRDALLDFKSSGKWIVASATHYGQSNYYVASVADLVCLDPVGDVSWNGLSANTLYFTRLFEKIGVEMQIIKVGTFKSAVEPYFRTSMSEEDEMQTKQYLDGIWSEYKAAVSASRHLSEEQLDALADRYMGLQSAEEQLAAGLVDTILYAQDMDRLLRIYAGTKDYHLMKTATFAKVEREESEAEDKIAVYYLEGEIYEEGTDGIVAEEVLKQMKKIEEDEHIKAIVLRVNSPGGSAEASEHIWRAVQRLKESGKPVVVSMGGLAASGGYYISCGADYIYAEPVTLTGSIGIFGTIPSVKELRDKIGLDIDGVVTNKLSALESNMIYKGMNDEERALMQTMVERGYDLFTLRCAQGRHMTQDEIKAIGEGRVWLGSKALELGLVDEMGNIDDAVSKAVSLANMESYQIVYYPEEKDYLDELMKELAGEPTDEEQMLMKIKTFVTQPRIMALMPLVTIE